MNELPLMEMFPTIQGEGAHQGKAAYFIRLGGCDVGCHWCDVKESWHFNHPIKKVEDIVKEASSFPTRLSVITGGEPLMHDLSILTRKLRKEGFKTHIETSGAHPLTGYWDWITLSPKKFKKPLEEIFEKASELKIIIYNKADLKWAEEMAQNVQDGCQLLLQPEWGRREKMMPLIVDFIKLNPRWQVSLQTHKYMEIP